MTWIVWLKSSNQINFRSFRLPSESNHIVGLDSFFILTWEKFLTTCKSHPKNSRPKFSWRDIEVTWDHVTTISIRCLFWKNYVREMLVNYRSEKYNISFFKDKVGKHNIRLADWMWCCVKNLSISISPTPPLFPFFPLIPPHFTSMLLISSRFLSNLMLFLFLLLFVVLVVFGWLVNWLVDVVYK